MEALRERYDCLSTYVQELSILGVKRALEKLPAEPSEKQLEEFEKKMVRAEKKQEEVDQAVNTLRHKRDVVRTVTTHTLFAEAQKNAGFMKTYNGCKNKLDKYTWDEQDKLVQGKPIMTDIGKINTDHLEKLWTDFVASKEPKKMLLNTQKFDTYGIKAKEMFQQFMPIFQKTPGATDKLEEWYAMEREMRAKLEGGEETVDVGPMELIRNELGTLIPKKAEKTEKPTKCIGSSRCKGRVVNGPYCQDCSTDYWVHIYEDMVKRNKSYKQIVGPIAYAEYERTLLSDFQEAHAIFEDKDGKKGWAELEKIYKEIDKVLPALEEDSSSLSDRPPGVAKYELTDKLPNDYESDIEEEEEEEEEYSDESSFSDQPTSKVSSRRKRRNSLGEVLAIFSGISPHVRELRKVWEEDGDSSEFEAKLKKIKQSFVERYKIKIYHTDTGTELPFLPGESVFFSREEADANGEKYVGMIKNQGNFRYEVEVLAPGE